MTERVLVTGGAGFIGSFVVDRLVERGHEVTVLDSLDPQVHGGCAATPRHIEGHLRAGRVRFHLGDVTCPIEVDRALEDVTRVVHLAATVGVGQSMYQPAYYTLSNCHGTGILLEALVPRRAALRRLVVASSMSLYGEGAYTCAGCGGSEPAARDDARLGAHRWEVPCARCGEDLAPAPTPESKSPDLTSVYAATKKHQEDLCIAFGRAYGLPTLALRFFNVFGPRQSLSNPYTGVAAIFLGRLLAGQPPLVFEDGLQSRDFIDVRDVARAVVLSVESEHPGAHALNIGTGKTTTVVAVAELLARELGVAVAPERLGKFRAGDIRHCVADPGRAWQVLGFCAEHTLAGGLGPLIEWCKGERPTDRVSEGLRELEQAGLVRG